MLSYTTFAINSDLDIDTYSGLAVTRLYDADNRMTKETQANSYEAGVYSYDGDGHRVKRKVGSVETWQVYGLGGELVAEYGANTAAASPQKEYGYRNGQLLVTITSGSGWGSVPSLDDNPLNPPNQPKTDVKAIHITQLRTAINALRSHYNLPAYQWQKPTASGGAINSAVLISWEPIDEMRTAIDQAIGPPPLGYSAGLAYGQPIKAVHIQELRDRLLQVWSADIRWLVTDQLGTPRMIFDQSGSLATVSRHDYLPFGEELLLGVADALQRKATRTMMARDRSSPSKNGTLKPDWIISGHGTTRALREGSPASILQGSAFIWATRKAGIATRIPTTILSL